ncbi:MmgE/PrpD family protein [Thermodesulfobacteriota bacterium]
MDAIYSLAKNVINTDYESLPPEVVAATKRLILDTVATGLGGSAREGVRELVDIFSDWAGKKESTVWVYGDKLPCVSAAQVNATMAHALDYDNSHDGTVLHTGVVAVPTTFAIAERVGRVDGKMIITAVALAVDLTAKLCLANTVSVFERGWHYTTLHGNFNAAAIAGKLLGLDEETLVNAFGLAYHQAGGNYQALHDGALAKRAGPGFSARNGIISVLMAQKGITGAKNILQGRDGLFNLYHRGDFNPEVLTANLGEHFETVNLSFKPYPCCRGSHTAIDATLALVREHRIKPEDVANVTVHVGKGIMELLCEPLSGKQNPSTVVDAQFSIPWVVASAIARCKVGVAEFTPQAIQDSTVLSLSNKVTPNSDVSLDRRASGPAIVEITTKAGNVYSERVDIPSGSPQNPMSMDAMVTKLRDCASIARSPMSEARIEKLVHMISHLEMVENVIEVVRLLT